ncbi:MAG: hypothetical protein KKE23_00920 [Nanoarchaeota archaeon]|nr:hypothetical protein [Nanoarchaeota archaeon]
MIVKLIAQAGSMKPNPALAQKMGPLGMNMGKIISDVNNATKSLAGMKIPVTLDINTKTKEVKVMVQQPSTSELLKKEFGIAKGSGQPQKFKSANVPIETLIKVAKEKQSLEKTLKSSLKTVVGSCRSLGILIESKEPSEITKEIESGVYDKLIDQEKTMPSPEKLTELKFFFDKIQKSQEEIKKKEEEEKAKAEEEKAAKAATAVGTATAPGAVPVAAKVAEPAKK